MSEYNAKKIKGTSGEWDIVIGLEVHAQVTTNLKLFSNGMQSNYQSFDHPYPQPILEL